MLADIRPQFDWSQLAERDRTEIEQRSNSIRSRHARLACETIAEGMDLMAIQSKLNHGQWLQWLSAEYPADARTAQACIKGAKMFAHLSSEALESLSRSVLFLISRETCPETARQEILELSQQKQIGSFAAAEQIVKRHQAAAKQGVPALCGNEQREIHRGPLAGKTVTVLERDEINVTVECEGEQVEVLCSDFVPEQPELPPQQSIASTIIPPNASLAIASMRGEYLATRVEMLEKVIIEACDAWLSCDNLAMSEVLHRAGKLVGWRERI